MSGHTPQPGTVVTVWYTDTDDIAHAIATGPHADRGFGRKFLAQLNPYAPATPIGEFPMNRSVPASVDEYYIAGYPGVTMVQTVVDDLWEVSKLDPKLLCCVGARDVYAFAANPSFGYAGFAHWHNSDTDRDPADTSPVSLSSMTVKRAFAAKRSRVYEDIGLPGTFEGPFWAGEMDDGQHSSPLDLRFAPSTLRRVAEREWLGFTVSPLGPTIRVVAFATDGRPEPKIENEPHITFDFDSIIGQSARKLGIGALDDYDDYETDPPRSSPPATDLKKLADDVGQALGTIGSKAREGLGKALGERFKPR
ncbi:DUF6928 family protein [Corynebacterium mendelii]|uniref:Uncharacterized protein n=1 Tax=Corynebacterium mendelii TaxID=2765362 RepID=A0A939E3A7_9CORY|nr:hypothetical protein [Corynebacterium mendelii]MBN9644657.1 hypothetical protein [Corynebacterium mendelii]